MRKFLRAKLLNIKVTGLDLRCDGSIRIDPLWLEEVGMLEYEAVLASHQQTGHRFESYLLNGEPGSRECVLLGPTARLAEVGDTLVIMTFDYSTLRVNQLPRMVVCSDI